MMKPLKETEQEHINWGPYVMKTKVPDYIIKKLIVEGKKAKKSYNYSLAGHLNHQYLYPVEVQKWFYDEIHPIIQAYRNNHCRYHGLKKLNVELSADDLWVNFMKAGDFNPIHTHGGDYSFVLFLDVPKSLEKEIKEFEGTSAPPGCLLFEYGGHHRPRWATTGTIITPKKGEMYIFPALLQHWVCPFKSKVTRISVSGNLRILNRDKLPSDYF